MHLCYSGLIGSFFFVTPQYYKEHSFTVLSILNKQVTLGVDYAGI